MCFIRPSQFELYYLTFLVPLLSITYGVVTAGTYSSNNLQLNVLTIPSAVQNVTLSINIEGKWILPDESISNDSILPIDNFSTHKNGIYKFNATNLDGISVCVIQIRLTSINTISGEFYFTGIRDKLQKKIETEYPRNTQTMV